MKNKDMYIDVRGSGVIKFSPGHLCGDAWGFGIYHENWIVAENFRTSSGFSLGGVMSFEDIDQLYKTAVNYRKNNKRPKL